MIFCGSTFMERLNEAFDKHPEAVQQAVKRRTNDLTGIATLTHDPLATYHLHGSKTKKGSRK